jgi:hypothetical protein
MLNQRPNDFHLAATSGENLVATHGDAGCTLIRLAQGTHRRFAHREYQPADVAPVDRRRTHRTGLPARIDRSPAERLPGHCGRRCTKRLHFRMSSPVSRIMGSNGPRFRYDLSLAVAYDSTEWPPAARHRFFRQRDGSSQEFLVVLFGHDTTRCTAGADAKRKSGPAPEISLRTGKRYHRQLKQFPAEASLLHCDCEANRAGACASEFPADPMACAFRSSGSYPRWHRGRWIRAYLYPPR